MTETAEVRRKSRRDFTLEKVLATSFLSVMSVWDGLFPLIGKLRGAKCPFCRELEDSFSLFAHPLVGGTPMGPNSLSFIA
jgi:hypothetical protein